MRFEAGVGREKHNNRRKMGGLQNRLATSYRVGKPTPLF